MIDKAMRSLIFFTVSMALPPSGVRGNEPLPPRALARIGDHRFYHGPGITCAVLSPDGRRIASSTNQSVEKERDLYDPVINLWDATTGERLRELRAPDAPISKLAFSPDGKRLAAAFAISEKRYGVVVFAVETGKILWQWKDFARRVVYLQFSADGRQLRVSEWRGPVSAWDSASGKRLRLWKPPPDMPPTEVETGLCGARGILSPVDKVIVWEMARIFRSGAFQGSKELRVHDIVTDKLLYKKQFAAPQYCCLESFAFSGDGKRLAVDCNNLTVWETATGKELAILAVPNMGRFALSPDGRHAAICEDQESRLRLWNFGTGKASPDLYRSAIPLGRGVLSWPLTFSADGNTLLLATDSTLRLFDTQSGKERAVPGHRAAVTPRFSADGRTLFTSCDEKKCRWDISSVNKPALLGQEPRKSWDNPYLDHSTDERFFLDRAEDRFQVRETATGRVLREWKTEELIGGSSHLAPNAGRVLLVQLRDAAPDLFRLYDVKTGEVSGEFKPADRIGEAAFSPDARLIAWADRAGGVHLHDAATGKAIRTLRSSRLLPEPKLPVASLFFSPDSDYLFETRFALPMRVFQVSSGREIRRFYEKGRKNDFSSWMACSPDSRLLAVAEEQSGIVRLLEIASGKVRAEFAGHRHGVHGLAFAPDGKTLASGGEDNVVFLWDVTGAKTLAIEKKTPAACWSDLASDDGKRAGVAIASLIRTPEQSVAFLQQRLRPAEILAEKRLARLLADLDSDVFETRETASRELVRLGDRAEATLRRAVKNCPSLEVRRRIEVVLNKLEPTPPPAETFQALRAIEVLEQIGTPAARRCLEALAKGAADAPRTRVAKAALNRLAKRRK